MGQDLFRINLSGVVGLLFAAFAALWLPAIVGSLWLSVFTSTACFALAIAGVAFMYARLGMVSLTQVGLMGIGGWVMLRVNYAFGLPFELSLIVAGFVTMCCSMLLALPALRLRGLYLALVTLMAAGGLEIVFATFQFPNGGSGFWGVQTGLTPEFQRPISARSDAAYLRFTVVIATLGFIAIALVSRMTPGRAWALIRRSEAAAMAAGVNVTRFKTVAFALSGLLGGIAGALLAGSLGLLDGQTFKASESVLLFALAVVGGARYWFGVIIAAALLRILPALLNNWGIDADLSFVIFGVGLLHAVITAPDGIAGQLNSLTATLISGGKRKRGDSTQTAHATFTDKTTLNSESPSTPTPIVASGIDEDSVVNINNVTVNFGGVIALDKVCATFTRPVSGIIGPNGAGKTTLMNMFSGFIQNSTGSIDLGGDNFMRLAPHQRGQWGLRRTFQQEQIAEDLTVAENVLVQLDSNNSTIHQRRDSVSKALEFVGLQDMANIQGSELNRFERRLTDIARCVAGTPKLILLDEPAGGLSVHETEQLGRLILTIQDITGAPVIVIDHDVELIERICAETLVLDFGKAIAFGPTSEVLANAKVKTAYLGGDEVSA